MAAGHDNLCKGNTPKYPTGCTWQQQDVEARHAAAAVAVAYAPLSKCINTSRAAATTANTTSCHSSQEAIEALASAPAYDSGCSLHSAPPAAASC